MDPVGFLVSQVGYDLGWPVRGVIRGPDGWVPDGATWRLMAGEACVAEGPVEPFGRCWQTYWWTLEARNVPAGRYRFVVDMHVSDEFDVAPNLLWDRTVRHVGIEQAKRRAIFKFNAHGWQDCGDKWQEANSHAAYVNGFLDLLEFRPDELSAEDRTEIVAQAINGLEYLADLQDFAAANGHPAGALVHQTPRLSEIVLPGDAYKAAAVWARASVLASDLPPGKADEYAERAHVALRFAETAPPLNPQGRHRPLHGAPDDYVFPSEPSTQDLTMALWARLALGLSPAAELAELRARQVRPEEAEGGLYGHFWAYSDRRFSEKAWTHHIDRNVFSPDAGGHFPNWILPLIPLIHEHPEVERLLRDFALGYLIPACRQNPFFLLPQGYYAGEGFLWFAGLWHGINAAYALTAATCFALAEPLGLPELLEIGYGNLQWIAGLNAGLTDDSLQGSVLWSTDVPAGQAIPHSMIYGVGRRWSGSWTCIRGNIANGFATGQQFKFDVPPIAENDAPSSYTDEDWISHAGAWLSALARIPNL